MNKTFEHLIREDLRQFTGYSSARLEQQEGTLFLNANELPWGEAGLNRYPEQQPSSLLNALSQYYGVQPNSLLATRGSDEGIDLLIRSFCQFGRDAVLICPPTFGMYSVSAKLQGVEVVEVPLKDPDFHLDRAGIEAAWTEKVKILFLCSPNNPTGNTLCREDVLALCEAFSNKAMVVVDEAYLEFSEEQSLSEQLLRYDNLVVLRTASKALGLAALRIGVLIANEALIAFLKTILAPYPLSVLAVQSVIEALDFTRQSVREQRVNTIKAERDQLIPALRQLAVTRTVWPSQANFVLVQFKTSIEPALIKQGIVVRNMEKRLKKENLMRITVGTPEENSQLIRALRLL